mmetsp:Transcript_15858/g.41089  ORF Transcript_15858/g.41089 Transcript_15858/m.41089 type:complete len:273 (-) Transcript_15858:169-987(-)
MRPTWAPCPTPSPEPTPWHTPRTTRPRASGAAAARPGPAWTLTRCRSRRASSTRSPSRRAAPAAGRARASWAAARRSLARATPSPTSARRPPSACRTTSTPRPLSAASLTAPRRLAGRPRRWTRWTTARCTTTAGPRSLLRARRTSPASPPRTCRPTRRRERAHPMCGNARLSSPAMTVRLGMSGTRAHASARYWRLPTLRPRPQRGGVRRIGGVESQRSGGAMWRAEGSAAAKHATEGEEAGRSWGCWPFADDGGGCSRMPAWQGVSALAG